MSGRGRRKVQGGLSHSRKNFPCEVEKCDKTLRSDKLLDHYRSMVCFKANGEPVSKFSDEFAKLCDLKKAHTMFFIDHKYTLTKLPSVKSVTPSQSPTNPFDVAKAKDEGYSYKGEYYTYENPNMKKYIYSSAFFQST